MKKVKKEKEKVGVTYLGAVHTNYVQMNVPPSFIVDTAEAVAQALLSDYYSAYLAAKNSDEQ